MICSDGENVNVNTYLQLHTTIDMEGMMDLLEMHETHESWKHAEMKNMQWRAGLPT